MISTDRKKYSEASRLWAMERMNGVRNGVKSVLGPDQLAATRFNSDRYVFETLETMTSEAEFKKFPYLALDKTFREAARADYWYQHEKDYGHDE